jgi:hypothetical protein
MDPSLAAFCADAEREHEGDDSRQEQDAHQHAIKLPEDELPDLSRLSSNAVAVLPPPRG